MCGVMLFNCDFLEQTDEGKSEGKGSAANFGTLNLITTPHPILHM
jgi:hypothetical protein